MWRYTLRRLSFLPIILLVVSILTFVLLRVLPTEDIADVIGGENATAAQKEQIREQLHLHDPIFPVTIPGECERLVGWIPKCTIEAPVIEFHKNSQYGVWFVDALHGDFGKTYLSQKSVRSEFERKFWPSVGRIESAFGDRNLVCSCPPVTAYME